RLGKTYGPVRLEAACHRALAFANPRYRTVKTILAKGLDQLPRSRRAVQYWLGSEIPAFNIIPTQLVY
ncbi:MAG: hypothetical protein HGB05_04585, partial [Chloroflexi bacterium]|nr:hypothetical protein [Chloroflexota bacterium]